VTLLFCTDSGASGAAIHTHTLWTRAGRGLSWHADTN